MNFNTLSPTSKMLKKLQSYSTGQPVTSGDVPNIAIINAADVIESKKLVENIVVGIKSSEGTAFVHNVPFFGYANKINPMTAKFAISFRESARTNALAIIKTSMADGVVIVTDCDVTATGLLEGCLAANCPVVVLPLGVTGMQNFGLDGECSGKPVVQVAGAITSGKLTVTKGDEILSREYMPKNQSSLFCLIEKLGFTLPEASTNKRGSGIQLTTALETGKAAVKRANELRTLRKALTKVTWQEIVDHSLTSKYDIGGLYLLSKIFAANDVKITPEFLDERAKKIGGVNIVRLTGTAVGGGTYVQYIDEKPAQFSGKAWVYQNLEEADRALLGGKIPSGSVVVLHDCMGADVSGFAFGILGMGREKEIAIATDGICDTTKVLTVMLSHPNSYENEEFANIQNGDVLEIDVVKGRFNTNVMAKEQKIRQKKNTVKKVQAHF